MRNRPTLRDPLAWWQRRLDGFRLRIARTDAVVTLSLLGLLSGLLAGLLSILFRLTVESGQEAVLSAPAGSYENLTPVWRVALPVGGGLLIGLMLQRVPVGWRQTGIVHVMERLQYYQGRLPLPNLLLQFLGGAIALISGHSVGREGPGVHLGVAASSLPAEALGLPYNTLRLLAACGTSAAIAASFNTPLAGVAFAMEVLMFDYTVGAFAPVLLAAVSATALSQWVFGDDLAFTVPALTPGALTELPLVLLLGVVVGALAAAFIRNMRLVLKLAAPLPLWLRPPLAGLMIGLVGLLLPEVMGIGYDTVNQLIRGEATLHLLLAIIALKLLVSSSAVGLGIPGGLIGPALVIGAATGALFAHLAGRFALLSPEATTLYVLLGMGAMMAAALQAPLAGLIAIVELTGTPTIILPGMLAVITATLTSSQLHGSESLYLTMLRAMGRDYRNDPVAQSLRRIGVGAVIERRFAQLPRHAGRDELTAALREGPVWLLLREKGEPSLLLSAVDVALSLKEGVEEETIDLTALPGERLQAAPLEMMATLQEAHELLQQGGAEALYITRTTVPGIPRVYGVLTREAIDKSYRF